MSNANDLVENTFELLTRTLGAPIEVKSSLGKGYTRQHQEVEPGAYVMIALSDTETGMPPAVVGRPIDPLFTTRKVYASRGLCLSMRHEFINQSDGHIYVYSELDHGTFIHIYLPATEGELSYTETLPDNSNYKSNGEHILVIENDPDVRLTTVSILSKLGYEVTETAGASDTS